MKILHMSDTHGRFPSLPDEDFDVIVHSGDMLPNRTYGLRAIEEPFQAAWLTEEVIRLSHRYWDVPILVTPGNHDFIDATPMMRRVGIDAHRLVGPLELGGVKFWGHPWTPTFYDWAWMCGRADMDRHLSPARELMDLGEIDVFVSHGPMFGVLDRNREGTRCGCLDLRFAMQNARLPPEWILHWHIHEANGFLGWSRGIKISNAACGMRIIEVSK